MGLFHSGPSYQSTQRLLGCVIEALATVQGYLQNPAAAEDLGMVEEVEAIHRKLRGMLLALAPRMPMLEDFAHTENKRARLVAWMDDNLELLPQIHWMDTAWLSVGSIAQAMREAGIVDTSVMMVEEILRRSKIPIKDANRTTQNVEFALQWKEGCPLSAKEKLS